ncbi:MAG: Csu type fimbrial protein [Enterobacteriaceae bacterium]
MMSIGYRQKILTGALLLSALFSSGCLQSATTNSSMNVTAQIASGCILGGGGSDVSTFGTLNFGTISTLSSSVNVASSASAGTITVKCTSGLSYTIALDAGQNSGGSVTNGRNMLLSGGTQTLNYQLYSNTGYSQIWGNGTNGGAIVSATGSGSTQSFVIYGTLFSRQTQPASGQYSDTVTATISY